MSHPLLFERDDPELARVRGVCLGFPEAEEFVTHGCPAWKAGRIFCIYSTYDHPQSIIVIPAPSEHEALSADGRFFVPKYFPRRLAVDTADVGDGELAELVDSSYRQIALRRQLAALDAGQ